MGTEFAECYRPGYNKSMVEHRWMRCVSLLVVAVVWLSSPINLQAKKKRRGGHSEQVVAVYMSASNKPKPQLYAALANELQGSLARHGSLKVLWGRSLRRALRKKPESAFGKCGANVGCLTKLGKQAHADTVLVMRVAGIRSGVRAQVMVVDVGTGTIAHKADLELANESRARQAIKNVLADVVPGGAGGDVGPGSAEIAEIPLEMIIKSSGSGKPPDAGVAAAGSGGGATSSTVKAKPPPEEIPLAFGMNAEANLSDPSSATNSTETGALIGSPFAGPSGPLTLAAVSPDNAAGIGTSHPRDSSSSRVLSFVGLAVLGLGAAGLGAGGYYGLQTRYEVTRGPEGTGQVTAKQMEEDAMAAADRANLCFGVGGGLAVIGTVLVVLDLVLLDGAASTTTVEVGAGGAAATWSW